jgi:hypothetical protein
MPPVLIGLHGQAQELFFQVADTRKVRKIVVAGTKRSAKTVTDKVP